MKVKFSQITKDTLDTYIKMYCNAIENSATLTENLIGLTYIAEEEKTKKAISNVIVSLDELNNQLTNELQSYTIEKTKRTTAENKSAEDDILNEVNDYNIHSSDMEDSIRTPNFLDRIYKKYTHQKLEHKRIGLDFVDLEKECPDVNNDNSNNTNECPYKIESSENNL